MTGCEKIVAYALNHVPHYRKAYAGLNLHDFRFEKLPILTKDDILNNPDDFISDEYNIKDLLFENTSGSSGKVLTIYKTAKEQILSDTLLWQSRKKYVRNILDLKIIKFYAYRRINGKLISDPVFYNDREINLSLFDLGDRQLGEYADVIKNSGECWFFAPPSAMLLFARYVKKNRPDIGNIRFIELTGEMCSRDQQDYIEEAFGCRTANHYGTREFWGLAYQCPYRNLHVYGNYVHFEILDEENHVCSHDVEGQICLTGLAKYAMPLIRYKQGDIGKLSVSECLCGNRADILTLSGGRVTDYITTEHGETVNSIVLFYIVEKINTGEKKILQFQVIQNSLYDFTVVLVLTGTAENPGNIQSLFSGQLSEHLQKNIDIEFRFAETIEPDPVSRKHRYFINKISSVKL